MLRYLRENRGKIGGGVAGFLVALLLIIAWPVILMIFLIFLGILLGAIFDTFSKARRWLDDSITQRSSDNKKR